MTILNRKKKQEQQQTSDIAKTLGKRGGDKTLELHGAEHFAQAGKLGHQGKVDKYGKDYYSRIGKISAQKRKKKKEAERRKLNDPIKKLNTLLGGD